MEPTSGWYDSMGMRLHYLAWGDPSKPLLMAHHGFLDHAHSWRWVAERLAAHFYVVAPDARGHGDSEWVGAGGAYAFPDYLVDFSNLYKSLGSQEVVLLGHSMGASVVCYYACACPDNITKVVLLEGMGPQDFPLSKTKTHLSNYIRHMDYGYRSRSLDSMVDINDAAARLMKGDSHLSKDRALALAATSTRPHKEGGVVWKFDPLHRAPMAVPFSVDRAIHLWSQVKAPVLHIRGADSKYVFPDHQDRLAAFNDIREAVIPNATHNLHTHATEAVLEQVVGFLQIN